MFSQADITKEIERIIPTLHRPSHLSERTGNVYEQVGALSKYISDKACNNELKSVKKALYLIDTLYQKGNASIKVAIENVFVFSITSTLMRLGNNQKKFLGLIPITLFTLYINQVLHKGC